MKNGYTSINDKFNNLSENGKISIMNLFDCYSKSDSDKTLLGIFKTNLVPQGPGNKLGTLCPIIII